MNNSLSFSDFLQSLNDFTSLQLHFAWGWTQSHPQQTIRQTLRDRIDLCRKTDPQPKDYDEAAIDYSRPTWLELENTLTQVYDAVDSADAFEACAMTHVQPIVQTFAERTFGSTCKMDQYQCGSLKYDKPKPLNPKVVIFHIGNAVAPASIFANPTYLPHCLIDLMCQSEDQYGADTLYTHTWLNSLPKWLALFPEQWQANLEPIETDVQWHYGFWGQFISAKGTLNHRYAAQLRQTGQMPYYPRGGKCSFTALRTHLQNNELV